MERKVLDALTTNHYKALKFMYDRRSVPQSGQRIVSITQREIGEFLKVSKPTVIVIVRNLREFGLITQDEVTKGRYYITDDGDRTVKSFEANFSDEQAGASERK